MTKAVASCYTTIVHSPSDLPAQARRKLTFGETDTACCEDGDRPAAYSADEVLSGGFAPSSHLSGPWVCTHLRLLMRTC